MQEEIDNLKQQIIMMRTDMERLKSELIRQSHNGFDGERIQFDSLAGLIKTITSATELTQATAGRASSVRDQIFIDTTTGTKKLYIYDAVGNVWRSVTIA
jgi:hypothetical protein